MITFVPGKDKTVVSKLKFFRPVGLLYDPLNLNIFLRFTKNFTVLTFQAENNIEEAVFTTIFHS